MNKEVEYNYAEGDLLEERNTYQYTMFLGKDFLRTWLDQRNSVLEEIGSTELKPVSEVSKQKKHNNGVRDTYQLLVKILSNIENKYNENQKILFDELKMLVKRFEITKRIHSVYNENFKPIDKTKYYDLELYILFSDAIEKAYSITNDLVYLNALLKLIDTLSSQRYNLSQGSAQRLAIIIEKEKKHIIDLSKNMGVHEWY